jgi:hypothetical protein|tara:strand:- start:405 stop:749 length:345 start_codon:yes stop_codon:yes gene_type:complete
MGYFVTAKQAREKARKDTIIQGETAAIEAAVFSAIDSNLLTVTLGDATTMTHTTAGAQLILAQLYYSVWQGGTTDATKSDQMAQVIKYFVDLGYSIHRIQNSGETTVFQWVVSW